MNLKLMISIFFLLFFNLVFSQDDFNGEKAFSYLEKQVDFGPRVPGTDAHRLCAEYYKQFFENLGLSVIEQKFNHYDVRKKESVPMVNIIARISPEIKQRILLCAHWDSRPMSDMDVPQNRNKPVPGANDGASGVAVLMHLAEILVNYPPPVGVDIVLFDGEDYGPRGNLDEYFLGSRHFINTNTQFFPKLGILLDMIGDKNLNIKKEGYSLYYASNWVDLVWQKARELGYNEFVDEFGAYIEDDHLILNKGGIQTINLIDFEYPNPQNSYWHTQKDIPSNCSPQSLQVVGDLLVRLIFDTNWMGY